MHKQNYTVLELSLKLKTDWEYLDRRDLARVAKVVQRWCKRGKYGGKVIGMLVVTNETSTQLMDRLRPSFDAMPVIEDAWCQTAGRDAIGRHGNFCPFQTAVDLAWKEVDKRNYPKKVPQPRSRNIWLDHRVDYFNRKAAVKMGLNPRGKRQGQEGSTTDRDK